MTGKFKLDDNFCNPVLICQKPQYRVQLPPDARYSEWRDIDVPIDEPYILSFQFNEFVNETQRKEFYKQIDIPAALKEECK